MVLTLKDFYNNTVNNNLTGVAIEANPTPTTVFYFHLNYIRYVWCEWSVVCEWIDEEMKHKRRERRNEWTNETNERMKRMNEWTNERMNEWMSNEGENNFFVCWCGFVV